MIQSLLLLLILIILNAIFASAEIAIISMNDARLRNLAGEGDQRARKLINLTEQPSHFLATIQVAITLAGLLQSAFAADNFAEPLVTFLVNAGITVSPRILKSISIIVITLVLAYFNLVFGELVPKRIAMKKAERMALGLAGLLYSVSRVFAPLVWILTASTNLVLRLIGINPDEEDDFVTEEEIRMLLMEGNEKGTIQADENEMIQNVFELNDISVEEICTHRREVDALFIADSEEEWGEVIHNSRHTFYPVCGDTLDDVMGILDTKDYFRLDNKSRETVMAKAVDQAIFIPDGMRVNILFRKMKQSRVYFTVLIDEYGGVSGIVTLHDLMETLVGDLEEKEEPEKPEDVELLSDGCWRIRGSASLTEVSRVLKRSFPTELYDTFNGYVCGIIGRVPADGENFIWEGDGLEIAVCEVSNHMIQEAVVTWNSEMKK